ncbi:MAG: hypothetical protein FD180_4024 [Planctomycetota bacterium]|nr:MAG: hypothetical protein FD180_4024 [Planctomycetota bacterium]
MPKFPEPPSLLTTRPEVRVLRRATMLWRVTYAAGPHPASWRDLRHFGPTSARFDHHDPPPHLQARGILYAAEHPLTCLAEVFQAARTIDRAGNSPWLAGFEITKPIKLLDLTGAWPTRAGASMAINSGPRPRARRWSRAIHTAYRDVQGLLYASSMHGNRPALALYERARPALPHAPVFHRALTDPAMSPWLSNAAARLGYRIV